MSQQPVDKPADSEALIVLDGTLSVSAANQAFYRSFRLAPSETIGTRVDVLGGRKWDPKLAQLLEGVLAGRSQTEHFELIADASDPVGGLYWLRATLLPSAGNEPSILLAFENVTAREKGYDAAADRTGELEAFARFAGETAHTFNNLLTVIGMTSDLLRSAATAGSPELADLEEIHVAAKRAADLTKELLLASRRALPQVTGLDRAIGTGGDAFTKLRSPDVDPVTPDVATEDRFRISDLRPLLGEGDTEGGETILLVDDESALRSLTRRVLNDDGYRVLEAPNGAVALRLAAAEVGEIDLVLTDVEMPMLGGRGMVEELRELSPGINVVFMSGYTDNELLRRGGLHVENGFLHKPFSPEELRVAVRNALRRRPGQSA